MSHKNLALAGINPPSHSSDCLATRRDGSDNKTCRTVHTRPRCQSLHSNYMLNRGYAYTTIISSKYHGQTLLSHLASLYPHSTPQAWQQKLNNGEVTPSMASPPPEANRSL